MTLPSPVLRSAVPAVLWAALPAFLLLTPGDSLPSDFWLLDLVRPEIMEVLTHSVLFFVQAVALVPVATDLVPGGGAPTAAAGVPDSAAGQLAVDHRATRARSPSPHRGLRGSSREREGSRQRPLPSFGPRWRLVSLLSLSYALILELLQIPVPGRGFGWIDLVADAVGILLAWVVVEARRQAKF